jgi:diketogulonate reductase-like aldo/keto reductase
MLNWAIARGTLPIPRSGSSAHIQENIEIFDFKMSADEMEQIAGLD